MTEWPKELTDELRFILGLPNFRAGPIAHGYQTAGMYPENLKRRAEDEQAFVLFRLVTLYLEHGDKYNDVFVAELEEVRTKGLARLAELKARKEAQKL